MAIEFRVVRQIAKYIEMGLAPASTCITSHTRGIESFMQLSCMSRYNTYANKSLSIQNASTGFKAGCIPNMHQDTCINDIHEYVGVYVRINAAAR